MRTPFIVGNWKMNTSLDEAIALAKTTATASETVGGQVDTGICPPYPWIVPVQAAVRGTALRIGAQDCAATTNGAHTGDVSASMLAEQCAFTLIGHSERRAEHHDTDEVVNAKVQRAFEAGLHVILCVGETKTQRDAGHAHQVVRDQLTKGLANIDHTHAHMLTIAYEPIWCIGTGDAATCEDATDMAHDIRETLQSLFPADHEVIRILYGGSANDTNAAQFLASDGIDGLLVGGASLSGDTFARMIRTALPSA